MLLLSLSYGPCCTSSCPRCSIPTTSLTSGSPRTSRATPKTSRPSTRVSRTLQLRGNNVPLCCLFKSPPPVFSSPRHVRSSTHSYGKIPSSVCQCLSFYFCPQSHVIHPEAKHRRFNVCVSDQLSRLHMILKPFMLRRIKKDVENELSDKVEEHKHDLDRRRKA